MAKGLLFALVRKGSKLNYLDDDARNNQSEREQKVHHEKVKSRFQTSRVHKMVGGNATEGNSTQRTISSKERGCTTKKLFDLTLQKISKGCKINLNSPACSRSRISTEDAFAKKDLKSDHRSKPMLVASVATGYFVNERDDASKETILKRNGNERFMPRIVLTDHDVSNSSSTCKSLDYRPRVQYSRYNSVPQLKVDEKRKRPSSWTEGSSPRLNEFTDSRKRIVTNSLEVEQIRGLWIEAMPISASPSTQRKNFGSTNSLRGQSRQVARSDSSLGQSGTSLSLERNSLSLKSENRFVKRASSWSRGDDKVGDFNIDSTRQNRKIDIFLPTM